MANYDQIFEIFARQLKKHVVPFKTNLKKIRLGKDFDGGYVLADLPHYDALYSYGCDDKIHFEQAFHDTYKVPCYVYDPFKGISNKPDFIHYFKEGLCSVKTSNMDTLDAHIERNGHTASKNLLGQIDIEGSEWGVFEGGYYKGILNSDSKHLENFSQIIIEFHLPLEFNLEKIRAYEAVFGEVFTHLNDKFVCIHVHGNNCPIQPWFDHNFPRVFEATYVRRDLVDSCERETEPYPIKGLDFACNHTRPDLPLDYFVADNSR